jgi:hypothetical protein
MVETEAKPHTFQAVSIIGGILTAIFFLGFLALAESPAPIFLA